MNLSFLFSIIVPLIEYYAVLDAWMLFLRYMEAIIQNQSEMVMYVNEWKHIRETLKADILHYQSIHF